MDKYKEREYMGRIGNNVINHTGGYDGKYNSIVSLSSHILDVSIIGMKTYMYDKDDINEEDIDILSCALTLHDLDKVMYYKLDIDKEHTDKELLREYFEYDWFGIIDYLGKHSNNPVDEYFDIIYYLIKRTEKRDSIDNLPNVPIKYRQMSKYCELSDSTVSIDDVSDKYNNLLNYYSEDYVHTINITRSSRPIIHFLVLDSIKNTIINNTNNIIIGNTDTDIIYIGNNINIDKYKDDIINDVSESIKNRFDFNCKATGQILNYNALPIVDIKYNDKKDIIRSEYIDNTIKRETWGTKKHENIPEEYKEYLPVILHRLYVLKDYDFDNDTLNEYMDNIKDEYHGSKYKVKLIHKVLDNYDEVGDEFITECKEYEDDLKETLLSDNNIIENVVDTILGNDYQEDIIIPSNDEVCYMCGKEAHNKYQGNTLFTTEGYSKRTEYEQKYKNICDTCLTSNAIFNDIVDKSEAYGDDIIMVYFYYNTFTSSLSEVSDKMTTEILDGTLAFDDSEDGIGAITLYNPTVHIQPITVDKTSAESEKNRKLRTVKNILERVKSTGLKVTLSTPFKPFESNDSVFVDNNSIREQNILGLKEIERYEDIDQKLSLLSIGNQFQGKLNENYPYQYIIPNEPENIINNSSVKFDIPPNKINNIEYYINNYNSMSGMYELAEKGYELYGFEYDSKHKRTKVVRECLNTLIDAKQKSISRDEMITMVSGKAQSVADRMSDGNYNKTKESNEFSKVLIEYVDDKYDNIAELTKKQNTIINTYDYAYLKCLDKHSD